MSHVSGSNEDHAPVRRRVTVTGRVQGVYFRASCADEARRLGVAGHVYNTSDGSVEGVFEGQPAAVEALIEWCRRGPELARVVEVIAVEERTTGTDGFLVL